MFKGNWSLSIYSVHQLTWYSEKNDCNCENTHSFHPPKYSAVVSSVKCEKWTEMSSQEEIICNPPSLVLKAWLCLRVGRFGDCYRTFECTQIFSQLSWHFISIYTTHFGSRQNISRHVPYIFVNTLYFCLKSWGKVTGMHVLLCFLTSKGLPEASCSTTCTTTNVTCSFHCHWSVCLSEVNS